MHRSASGRCSRSSYGPGPVVSLSHQAVPVFLPTVGSGLRQIILNPFKNPSKRARPSKVILGILPFAGLLIMEVLNRPSTDTTLSPRSIQNILYPPTFPPSFGASRSGSLSALALASKAAASLVIRLASSLDRYKLLPKATGRSKGVNVATL